MHRNKLAQMGVFALVIARMFSCPAGVIAQTLNSEPEVHIVEPIITEETMPNESGEWTVRLSGSYLRQGIGGSGFLPRAQVFFGIAERWGGEVELPMAFAREDSNHYGVGDISATVKYLVRKPSVRMPGFVVGLETVFPTGKSDKGLGEGVFEAAPFVATVYATRRAVLQGNFGYSAVHRARDTEASNQFFYNGALAFPFERIKTWSVWEINGTHATSGNQISFSPGLKYNLTPERYLAIAFPIGLNSQTPRWGVVLQLQFALLSAKKERPAE
jgi:hypothetical protein